MPIAAWMVPFLLAPPAYASAGADLRAAEILQRVSSTYSSLHAVHITATRSSEQLGDGAANASMEQYEFAEDLSNSSARKYKAEIKTSSEDSLAVNTGSRAWKAFPRAKRWAVVDLGAGADLREYPFEYSEIDPFSMLKFLLVLRYPMLVQSANHIVLEREATYKLGKKAVAVSIIHFESGKKSFELWVDEKTGLVLQDIQFEPWYEDERIAIKTTMRLKSMEFGCGVDPAVFQTAPAPAWQQTDMLTARSGDYISLAGMKAANIRGSYLDGRPFDLQAISGTPVVLFFWLPGCRTCVDVLEILEKVRKRLGGDVAFIGIVTRVPAEAREVLRRRNIAMEQVADSGDAITAQYGVRSWPQILMIDRHGIIASHSLSCLHEDVVDHRVRDLL